ncbi:MAG: hypothetical protein ABI609_10315 [Acidobacteriota bacterium]
MTGRAAWWVFATLALFYCLTTSGHVLSPDAVLRARAAEGLLEHGRPSIDPIGVPQGFLAVGRLGDSYPKYEAGPSLAALPFLAIGAAAAKLAPAGSEQVFRGPIFLWYSPDDSEAAWRFAGMVLTNAFLVAALCAVLFALALELGYSPRAALIVTAAAAVASPLWVYSKDLFAEPLAGLGLLVFALFVERLAKAHRWQSALWAGAGFGVSVLARFAHLALLPLAFILAAHALRGSRDRRSSWASSLAMAAGLGLLLLLGAWWNWVRFGSIWVSGYGEELRLWTTPPLLGLSGLLFSPGRGLLPHFPLVLLAVAATPASWRRSIRMTLFAWGTLITLLVVYCRWHGWDGGWCWGPRFLVPAIAPLVLLCAPFFDGLWAGTWKRVAGYGLLAVSGLIAFTGTLVAYTDFDQALRHAGTTLPYLEVVRWSWTTYPPVAYWPFEPKEFYLLFRALRTPQAWWLAALFGAGFGLLPVMVRHTGTLVLGTSTSRRVGWRSWALIAGLAVLFGAIARL